MEVKRISRLMFHWPGSIGLFHVGAGTIILEIISSFREVSVGGGGHTNDSMISSVVFIKEAKSGGSVREDLGWSEKIKI